MDPVMSRPQAGERLTASHPRRIVGTLVALVMSLAALIALPQAAQAADVLEVPDANFKAVLNQAIATATTTTRTPDQDITPAEALAVTTIDTGYAAEGAPIATLTGLEAFANVTTLAIRHPGSTVTDLRPIGSLSRLASLSLWYMQFASLDGLESVATLNLLNFANNEQLTDVSALSRLSQLQAVSIQTSPRLKDVSALAGSKASMRNLTVTGGAVEDISFLVGFKNTTSLALSNNRIEDVSVFATFDDSYRLNDVARNPLSLQGNRIRDFSPVATFRNIKGFGFGPATSAFDQSIHVGPYDAVNGVTVPLKSGPATNSNTPATPAIMAGTGTYDPATGLLTSADPSAPFVQVDPNWTIHFSEAPDKLAALKVNEVESNGDSVNGDWVELYNPANTAVDVGGLVVADNDDTHKIVVPAGTKIPATGYATVRTDDPAVTGQFGLGGADSVRIFAPGTTDLTTTPIDAHSWTSHATTTYGRTVPGAGTWATTSGGTFGAVNEFPPPTVVPTVAITGDATSTTGSAKLTATVTKPDSTDLATDATGTVVFAVDGNDVSGPVTVANGKAEWTAPNLAGSPSGTAHQMTARYVSAGDADPYDDSVASAQFTVTVTIGNFAGEVTLSTATPQVCQTIASDVAGITPTPDTVTYQWQDSSGPSQAPWVNMIGETGTSHALRYRVSNGNLEAPSRQRRLVVTASKAGYAAKVFTSTETAAVGLAPFLTAPAATLNTSAPKVGEKITATHPEWTTCAQPELNWKVGYEYQWLRDGEPISGATDVVAWGVNGAGPKQVSYTATPADAGHTISLRVTGSSTAIPEKAAVSAETSAVTAGAFSTSPAPTIDNVSPKVGETLKASTAAWSPAATFAYQWLRDGQPIAGATTATYTTVAADADHALSVRATGTAEGYATAEKTSAATAKVAKLAFTGSPVPVIGGGVPTVGDTLTATVAAWAPVASFTWQWLRDGQPIDGATAAAYTVTTADQGRALSVRVTGAADGYESADKTSAATPQVVARPVTTPPVPGVTQVNTSVSAKYSVKVTAQSGRKLRLSVSAKNVPASAIDKIIRIKIAGVKGSYAVTVKNGKATVSLGSKAKTLKKGKKVTVTVTLAKLTSSTTSTSGTTTTYTVAKATKRVKVKLK